MRKLIVGIGAALVDILVSEDEAFLEKTGAAKGGMKLVDNLFIENVLSKTASKPFIVPGGSACNTIIGIGQLGGEARFIGKRGEDELGMIFENSLKKSNIEPKLLISKDSPTGKVLSIITPDAQRSMFTFLGASSDLAGKEIIASYFEGAKIVHIEGYLVVNQELFLEILKVSKKSGAKICLDLSSFTIVEASKELLKEVAKEFVDIIIANEDEAYAFTGYREELKALEELSKFSDIAVQKIGKRGSYISHAGKVLHISPMGNGKALDTTGAGDLWASGFLFGLANGYSLEQCGKIGSACGWEVCQVIGANIPEDGWKRIKKLI
ncbi:MAG: adenosine kinase [Desulfobacterales bacterium]|nr:adenosine kinase [Desulfobacterales bacterium]MBF0395479.1 adenosine kinase [Desulfobacterales bacterium]